MDAGDYPLEVLGAGKRGLTEREVAVRRAILDFVAERMRAE